MSKIDKILGGNWYDSNDPIAKADMESTKHELCEELLKEKLYESDDFITKERIKAFFEQKS
jgi:hypothetical protein